MSNEPKLVLHHHEMAAFKTILFESKEYYRKLYEIGAYENAEFLTEISLAYLKFFYLDNLTNKVVKKLELEYYTYNLSIDLTGCFHLLSAILPVNNLEWLVKVKELVLEYCVKVLKYNNLILDTVTFKPALPDLKAEFINPTTQMWEFLED